MQISKPITSNTTSKQTLSDVEELISCWADFYVRPDYYKSVHLPSILANPQKATMREKLLISCIGDTDTLIPLIDIVYKTNRDGVIKKEILLALKNYDFKKADSLNGDHEGCFPDYLKVKAASLHEYKQQLISKIKDALKRFDFDEAVRLYNLYPDLQSKNNDAAEYEAEWAVALRNYEDKIVWQIKEELKVFSFDAAAHIFKSVKAIDINDKYRGLIQEYRELEKEERQRQFVNSKISEIKSCLEKYDFTRAAELYDLIKDEYAEADYKQQVNIFIEKQIKGKKLSQIKEHLVRGSYANADAAYLNSDIVSLEDYQAIKSPFIRDFIKKRFGRDVNSEKTHALSVVSQNTLVSARAGSGKTSLLAYKVGILIDRYNINPDEILVLAFNKKATTEIKMRIQKEMGLQSFENARTFHSLAYQLVNPKGNLLFDDGTGEFSGSALSKFVQDLLRIAWTPIIQEKVYAFFRKEMLSVQRSGTLLSDKEYYLYVRNQRDITLGRERVKSLGEKYLADFFFEHDIPYSYEALEFWAGHNYHPDFSLYSHKMTVEFWGIDENDPDKRVPSWWESTWEQYHTQMNEKRAYWREKNIPLIEFSIADLRNGREFFEELVKDRLVNAGIKVEKLPQKEIEKRVVRIQIDRLTSLLVQFIQKAKKRMWTVDDVQKRLSAYRPADERERTFLQLANRIYSDYQVELSKLNSMDFDDLMMQSADLIDQTSGECGISLGARKDRYIRMNDLKWILIDEYQDFSALFFNVIQSIRKHNPQVNLLCVGDDWQAINSFAGSDLNYFTNFNNMFSGQQASLLTNFRSQKAVVEAGNSVMERFGEPGKHLPEKQGGSVIQQSVNDIWIEWRESDAYAESRKDDDRFVFYEKRENGLKVNDNGFVNARYLKACYQIITEKENWQKIINSSNSKKDKISVAILSRTNYMDRSMLSDFERKLHACFSPAEKKQLGDSREKIRTGTAHSFKGLEADIVIIVRANEGAFPLIHPDNALFKFFGQTEKDVVDEERRLFYVAVTRAAEKLYILTEEERESPFLQDLITRENIR